METFCIWRREITVHVYGDSFADDTFNTQGHDWAWTVQLSQRYNTINHAKAGTGSDYSVEALLNTDIKPNDHVVFVCSYANRNHYLDHATLEKCTPMFTNQWIQREYVKTCAVVKSVCPHAIVFVVDQNSVKNHIQDNHKFYIYPKPLLDLYEQDNQTYRENLWQDQGNRDRRPNHLQQHNHEHILKTIEDFVCK